MKQLLPVITLVLLTFNIAKGQGLVLTGTVYQHSSRQPLHWATVSVSGAVQKATLTHADGSFRIEGLTEGLYVVRFYKPGYTTRTDTLFLIGTREELPGIFLESLHPQQELPAAENEMAAVSPLDTFEDESYTSAESYYEPLIAFGDLYSRLTSYNFYFARYRSRGYDNHYNDLYLNGINLRDLSTGGLRWNTFSGLNELSRNAPAVTGLRTMDHSLGGIGGLQSIEALPLGEEKRQKVSYAYSNRDYRHRVMAYISSERSARGWTYAFSGSRRWGDNGFVAGAATQAWAVYGAIGKYVGNRQFFSISALYAPQEKNGTAAVTEEVTDLAGSRYYNSYWGYDGKKKRSARIRRNEHPLFIFNHRVQISSGSTVQTSASLRLGKSGYSTLGWNEGGSPYPDYYRYLPGYIYGFDEKEQVKTAWKNDPNVRQINWQQLRTENAENHQELSRVWDNGTYGPISGKRSDYVVENRETRTREFFIATVWLDKKPQREISAGIEYKADISSSYKKLEDLLDGDFWLDYDSFSVDLPQNNVLTADRVVRKGDRFGYSYRMYHHQTRLWAKYLFTRDNFRGYLGVEGSYSTFWRKGGYEKETFPAAASYGLSQRFHFFGYRLKTGGEFVLSPGSRAELNLAFLGLPQRPADSFLSPQSQNGTVPDARIETVTAAEFNYAYADHRWLLKMTAFVTLFHNQTKVYRMYDDVIFQYTDVVLTGIERTHAGIELAGEYLLSNRFSLSAAASLGKYSYSSNPSLRQYADKDGKLVTDTETVKWKNLRVPGTPQTIATIGLKYNGINYWFGQLSCNHAAHSYISMNPLRRTQKVYNYLRGDQEISAMRSQERFASAFTLDFFGGKSFRTRSGQFISVTISVSNLLNDRSIVSGGYEQYRFSRPKRDDGKTTLRPFDSKYYYAYGTNFFLTLGCNF